MDNVVYHGTNLLCDITCDCLETIGKSVLKIRNENFMSSHIHICNLSSIGAVDTA